MTTLLKPAPVTAPANLRVLSPASFAASDRLDRGLERLRSLGFAPSLASNAQTRGPLFFAGTPDQRIADLHAAFADSDAAFLASVRGGYGSNYLLESLDLELIRQNPKPFFAYSDLTGIQLRLLDRIGLPAFHGPMVAADFALDDGVHFPSFQAALAGQPYSVGPGEGLRTLRPGIAEGTLYGGCLSILVSLLGTPWAPDTAGKLLFFEDIGVKPYQIDRMLWQLHHAGKLRNIRGIIFGEMLDCASPGAEPDLLEKVLVHAFPDADFPIVLGLRSGHVSRSNVTLTFGIPARLEASPNRANLHLLEPAVRA
jgi:muramoyltetrapeptide carboxypeptidase